MSLDDLSGEASERLEPLRDLAIEAGRRALTAVASMHGGPMAGLAVGVALAAAAAIARRRSRLAKTAVGSFEAEAISINARLEELYARREKLQAAMEAARTRSQQRMIQEALRSTDSMIRDLEDMLELVMIVEEAKLRIRTTLGPKTAREVEKMLAKVEKGEIPSDDLYRLLTRINEEAEKNRIGIAVFAQLLGP